MRDLHLGRGVIAALTVCALGAVVGTAIGHLFVEAAAGAAILAAFLSAVIGVGLFAWYAWRHQRFARALRARSRPHHIVDTQVRITGGQHVAFVAGLHDPQIYCGDDLPRLLTNAELRAVALHERAHQLAKDPLRLTLLGSLVPLIGRTRRGSAWLERRVAAREIAADRYALANGASRSAIAAAILKVSPLVPAHAPGFGNATDLRLRALTSAPGLGPTRPGVWRSAILGATLGTVCCAVLLHPVAALLATVHLWPS